MSDVMPEKERYRVEVGRMNNYTREDILRMVEEEDV